VNKKLLETIRVENGVALHLAYHQLRLEQSIGSDTLQLSEILSPPPVHGLYRCRVVYDAAGYDVSYHSYTKRSVSKLKPIEANGLVYDKKYLDRSALDALFAKKALADDVLIFQNGLCRDTTIANIAFLYKKSWLTPRQPLLQGTTRARLLDEGKIIEEELTLEDIKKFEGVALMNAMIDFDIIPKKIEDIIC
jgi:4-amino-4-deoxychorismate lyase